MGIKVIESSILFLLVTSYSLLMTCLNSLRIILVWKGVLGIINFPRVFCRIMDSKERANCTNIDVNNWHKYQFTCSVFWVLLQIILASTKKGSLIRSILSSIQLVSVMWFMVFLASLIIYLLLSLILVLFGWKKRRGFSGEILMEGGYQFTF